MNLDLTAQFVRDYEELRRKADGPQPPTELLAEIERLQQEVERLGGAIEKKEAALGLAGGDRDPIDRLERVIQEMDRRLSGETARRDEELGKLRAQFAGQVRLLNLSHDEQLAQGVKAAEQERAEQARREKAAREALEAELARKTRALADEAKRTLEAEKLKLGRLQDTRLGTIQAQVASEIEGRLSGLAYVPASMRLSGLALDVLILAMASALIRFGTEWGQGLSNGTFILAMAVGFSLRAFVSPANLCLGISARHIGPHHRPEGRVGFKARLLCGLLHYGPLIACVEVAITDERTAEGLMNLLVWAFHPGSTGRTLPDLVNELLRPDSPGLPGVILALTLAWWALLALSFVFSSAIHRGTPYFRNTTLVEYLARVGLQRFSLPARKPSEEVVLDSSG